MLGAETDKLLPVLSTRAAPKTSGALGILVQFLLLGSPTYSVLPEAAEFAVLMQLFDLHDV